MNNNQVFTEIEARKLALSAAREAEVFCPSALALTVFVRLVERATIEALGDKNGDKPHRI